MSGFKGATIITLYNNPLSEVVKIGETMTGCKTVKNTQTPPQNFSRGVVEVAEYESEVRFEILIAINRY